MQLRAIALVPILLVSLLLTSCGSVPVAQELQPTPTAVTPSTMPPTATIAAATHTLVPTLVPTPTLSPTDAPTATIVPPAKGATLIKPTTAALPSAVTTDATAQTQGIQGDQIVFRSSRTGNSDIYLTNTTGDQLVRLTTSDAAESGPVGSPDGQRITFVVEELGHTNGPGPTDIWVMNADGSQRRQLTTDQELKQAPAWSPDGQRIAFDDVRDIWVMNADGSNRIQLTNDDANDQHPSWSPDGRRLVFSSTRTQQRGEQLFVINSDGTQLVQLTDSPSTNRTPVWSPEGSSIAFVSDRSSSGQSNIFVMRADGSDVRQITDGELPVLDLGWSPDNQYLVFSRGSEGSVNTGYNIDLFFVRADGTNLTRISKNKAVDDQPSWINTSSSTTQRPTNGTTLPGSLVYSANKQRFRVNLQTGTTQIIGGAPPAGSFVGPNEQRYWLQTEPSGADTSFTIFASARDGTKRTPLLTHQQFYRAFPEMNEPPQRLSLSADGTQLFFDPCNGDELGRRCQIFAFQLATREVRDLQFPAGWGATMAPDGKRALGTGKFYRPEGGAYFPTVLFTQDGPGNELQPGSPSNIVWLENGNVVYSTSSSWSGTASDANLVLGDRAGTPIRVLVSATEIADLALAPNGQHIAYLTDEGHELWVIDITGTKPQRIAVLPPGATDLLWSPNK